MPIRNMVEEIEMGQFALRLLIVFAAAIPLFLAIWWFSRTREK
jgi:hypothetical protein